MKQDSNTKHTFQPFWKKVDARSSVHFDGKVEFTKNLGYI